jgi:hypothetical protein
MSRAQVFNVSEDERVVNETEDDEADSVQGSPAVSADSTRSPTRSTSGTSGTVKLKFAPRSDELENTRKRLAAKILDTLQSGLQRPNTILLSTAASMLDTIWNTDHARLLKIYDKKIDNYRAATLCWTQCVNGLADFYNLAGFTRQEIALQDFLGSVDGVISDAAGSKWTQMTGCIAEWDGDKGWREGFARDVAYVLFHSASWHPKMMSLEKMEGLTVKFNKELLAWFD